MNNIIPDVHSVDSVNLPNLVATGTRGIHVSVPRAIVSWGRQRGARQPSMTSVQSVRSRDPPVSNRNMPVQVG
jgi:hypothetical protein